MACIIHDVAAEAEDGRGVEPLRQDTHRALGKPLRPGGLRAVQASSTCPELALGALGAVCGRSSTQADALDRSVVFD